MLPMPPKNPAACGSQSAVAQAASGRRARSAAVIFRFAMMASASGHCRSTYLRRHLVQRGNESIELLLDLRLLRQQLGAALLEPARVVAHLVELRDVVLHRGRGLVALAHQTLQRRD